MLHLVTLFSKIMVGLTKNFLDDQNRSEFGKTLADFGYEFNKNGELRHIGTNERFVFEVRKNDRAYNQKSYEALGEVIDEEIYQLLEKECKLTKIYIPFNAKKDEPKGFFFASEDAKTKENLLILIHGSGVVRAGQWARRLIINDNLNTGTQIPYIKRAQKLGYGIIVLNTNQNKVEDKTGRQQFIRESEDPSAHVLHIWDHFIESSDAKAIAIVAHSAGGYVTVNLALERQEQFLKRVFAVAFTDSVHSPFKNDGHVLKHFKKIAKNWFSAREKLDTPLSSKNNDIPRISAGTTIHELTSHAAIDSVFKFLQEKFDDFQFSASFLSSTPTKSIDQTEESENHSQNSPENNSLTVEVETDESNLGQNNGNLANNENDFEKVEASPVPKNDDDEKLSEILHKKRDLEESKVDSDQPKLKKGKKDDAEFEF